MSNGLKEKIEELEQVSELNKLPELSIQDKNRLTKTLDKLILSRRIKGIHKLVKESFVKFPNNLEPTNTWALKQDEEVTKTNVDYILLSKGLAKYISKYECSIKKETMAIDSNKKILMENDFDHALIELKLTSRDDYIFSFEYIK